MPSLRPEFPNFQSKGEKLVWEILKNELPNNSTIFQNQKLSLFGRSMEIDTFIVMPGHGMVCIEVKGGQVELLPDGYIKTNYHGTTETVNPEKQCDEYISALKNAVKNNSELVNPRIAWLAVLPDTELPSGTQRRSRYLDKNDLHKLREHVIKVAEETDNNRKTNSEYARKFINEIFGEDAGLRGWIMEQSSRDRYRAQKTQDRSEILEMTDARQFIIQGPPGCGKTQLALYQARRLKQMGEDIALISYSEAVARYFQREVLTWPSNERPRYVGTFHGLLDFWGIQTPDLRNQDEIEKWYQETSAKKMLDHLNIRSSAIRFSGFIVDEGQDFQPSWWDVINVASSGDHETHILHVFADVNETLFNSQGLKALPLFTLKINRTIRQSAPIAEFYKKVTGSDSKVTGLGGPEVTVIPIEPNLAMARAKIEIEKLKSDGWNPGDILVINTGRSAQEQKDELAEVGNSKPAFWDKYFSREKTFYCHISSAKGIESPVVVVVFDGWRDSDRKNQLTNAAISRATDKLVIVGDCSTIDKAKILWHTPDEAAYDYHTVETS